MEETYHCLPLQSHPWSPKQVPTPEIQKDRTIPYLIPRYAILMAYWERNQNSSVDYTLHCLANQKFVITLDEQETLKSEVKQLKQPERHVY